MRPGRDRGHARRAGAAVRDVPDQQHHPDEDLPQPGRGEGGLGDLPEPAQEPEDVVVEGKDHQQHQEDQANLLGDLWTDGEPPLAPILATDTAKFIGIVSNRLQGARGSVAKDLRSLSDSPLLARPQLLEALQRINALDVVAQDTVCIRVEGVDD